MNESDRTPLYEEENHEFLGFVAKSGTSWQALTIFGYPISRTDSREAAEKVLREKGLTYLMGVWNYYDKEDGDWFPCTIKEAFERKVIVNRTNELGYVDPKNYKQVTITEPSENNLVKTA